MKTISRKEKFNFGVDVSGKDLDLIENHLNTIDKIRDREFYDSFKKILDGLKEKYERRTKRISDRDKKLLKSIEKEIKKHRKSG